MSRIHIPLESNLDEIRHALERLPSQKSPGPFKRFWQWVRR
jgi:hypothetical protein